MGKVIEFHPTRKAIYQAAVKEMNEMYRLSSGGSDPIISNESHEMFERGEIDEVRWISWNAFCIMIHVKMATEDFF